MVFYIMDIRVILPIVTILAVGILGTKIVRKILQIEKKEKILEQLLEGLIIGTMALVVPMVSIALIAQTMYDLNPETEAVYILERFCYLYFAIGLMVIVYYIIKFVRKKLPEMVLKERKYVNPSIEKMQTIITIGIGAAYIILALLYPIRGWDALHFYLPNAFKIYITGRLDRINELNFMPQFKPPMNILLFVYAFFITATEMIALIPIPYFLGTAYLCYKIAKMEGITKKGALIATILFLVTPLSYFIVYEYIYYQEIFIMFFTTASYYYLRKVVKKEKEENNEKIKEEEKNQSEIGEKERNEEERNEEERNKEEIENRKGKINVGNERERIFYAMLAAFSLTGGVLSKESGYIIPLILLIALPSDKLGKVVRIAGITAVGAYITRMTLYNVYIGTAIIVIMLVAYCVYLIIKSEKIMFSWKRWAYIIGIYTLPIMAMGIWLMYMLSIQGVDQILTKLYYETKSNEIILNWRGIIYPESETYIETAHNASFIAATFAILIAAVFAPGWIILKMIGIKEYHKKNKELSLWLIGYLICWLGMFSTISIRYLTPLLVPLSILTAVGVVKIVELMNKRDGGKREGYIGILFLALIGFSSTFPVIPIEALAENFNMRWYYTHTQIGSVLLQVAVLNSIVFLLLWKEEKWKITYKQLHGSIKINKRKIVAGILIVMVIMLPIMAQMGMITISKFDMNKFHEDYTFFSREAYKELIQGINLLGIPENNIILSINTPGLEYYTARPVLDLFMLTVALGTIIDEKDFPLAIQNTTKMLEFFEKYNITTIVSMNKENGWYTAFYNTYYWEYSLYRLLNHNKLFQYQFSNNEYFVYTLKEEATAEPYIGPVDIQIKGENNGKTEKESILYHNPNDLTAVKENAMLSCEIDLTAIQTNRPINVSITTNYTTFTDPNTQYSNQFYTIEKSMDNIFQLLDFFTIPKEKTIIHSINIKISYYNSTISDTIDEKEWIIESKTSSGLIIYYWDNSWRFIADNGLVFK